jgi:cytochrome c-type biogenesis protein
MPWLSRLRRHLPLIVACGAILGIIAIFLFAGGTGRSGEIEPAPDFEVVDQVKDESFNLSQLRGNVTLLHFTQLENPLCLECEEYMIGQMRAFQRIVNNSSENIEIVTLNIRKNAYSDDGLSIANNIFGVNVTWRWVEEFNPFAASALYSEYWEMEGGFANPTIVLIDMKGDIVGVYHIYCMGRGAIDGVQTSESLLLDAEAIASGDWDNGFKGSIMASGATLGGFFALGIITSFSPCSIALLFVVISYVATRRHKSVSGRDDHGGFQEGMVIGLYFTLGTAMVFLAFGLIIAEIGTLISSFEYLQLLIGVVLVLLGINIIHPLRESLGRMGLNKVKSDTSPGVSKGFFGELIDRVASRSIPLASFLLGVLFSIGWAPCAMALVLPVLMILIANGTTVIVSGALMFVFGLGHGMIILPFCVATGDLRKRVGNRFIQAGKWIQITFGLTVITLGIIYAMRLFGYRLW